MLFKEFDVPSSEALLWGHEHSTVLDCVVVLGLTIKISRIIFYEQIKDSDD